MRLACITSAADQHERSPDCAAPVGDPTAQAQPSKEMRYHDVFVESKEFFSFVKKINSFARHDFRTKIRTRAWSFDFMLPSCKSLILSNFTTKNDHIRIFN